MLTISDWEIWIKEAGKISTAWQRRMSRVQVRLPVSASKTGIYSADTVLVPLEDGDRAEILSKTGKKTITIDLNPLSRTSQTSNISIVDNVVRAFPFMTEIAKDLKTQDKQLLINMVNDFDNKENLKESLKLFKNN